MSYATQVFTYIQSQIVIIDTGYSSRIYMPQYSKPLSLHKGVDNQLRFQFLNQEQKPVNITGKSITCRIINGDGTKVLVSKALTLQLPVTGIATLDLNAAEIENISAQKAYYSLEKHWQDLSPSQSSYLSSSSLSSKGVHFLKCHCLPRCPSRLPVPGHSGHQI